MPAVEPSLDNRRVSIAGIGSNAVGQLTVMTKISRNRIPGAGKNALPRWQLAVQQLECTPGSASLVGVYSDDKAHQLILQTYEQPAPLRDTPSTRDWIPPPPATESTLFPRSPFHIHLADHEGPRGTYASLVLVRNVMDSALVSPPAPVVLTQWLPYTASSFPSSPSLFCPFSASPSKTITRSSSAASKIQRTAPPWRVPSSSRSLYTSYVFNGERDVPWVLRNAVCLLQGTELTQVGNYRAFWSFADARASFTCGTADEEQLHCKSVRLTHDHTTNPTDERTGRSMMA